MQFKHSINTNTLLTNFPFLEKEGEESGLTEEDYRASVATLHSIATTLEADCVLLRERTSEFGIIGQYLIRHRAEQEDFVEIRYGFFRKFYTSH